MDSFRIILKGLETADSSARDRCISKLRDLIDMGIDNRYYTAAIPILAKIASEIHPNYYVIEMLVIAAKKGINISEAIPTLKQIAHIPKFAGLRSLAKEALQLYYKQTGTGKLASPKANLEIPLHWSLIEVNPKAVYADSDFKKASKSRSSLPCGVCGSENTYKIHEQNESVFSNISGVQDITVENECRNCGNYSVFRYFEEIFL